MQRPFAPSESFSGILCGKIVTPELLHLSGPCHSHTHTHIHTFDLQHFVELSYEPGVDAGCCDLHNSKRGTGNLQPVVLKQAFLFESGKACRLLLSWCVRMGYGGIFRLMSCYHILISCKLSGMKQPACFCCAWVCILWDASSMMLLMCCFCA